MKQSPAVNHGQIAISPEQQVVVPLLCMHRSGGSLVARLLNLMGMELGWPLRLKSPENEHGFWEHQLFQLVNMQLLQGLGVDSDALLRPEVALRIHHQMGTLQLPEPDAAGLGSRIGSNFMQPVWGFKDPRTALTWPLWSRLFQSWGYSTVKPVVVIRHPDGCLESFIKSGQAKEAADAAGLSEVDFVHSLWWSVYQAVLASNLDLQNTLVVVFEDLMDPELQTLELARIAAHIGAESSSIHVAQEWLRPVSAGSHGRIEDENLRRVYTGVRGLAAEQRRAFRTQYIESQIPNSEAASIGRDRLEAPYCVYQVSPSGYPYRRAFDEIAESLMCGLGELGINAPLVTRVEDIVGTPIVVGVNLIDPRLPDTNAVADQLPKDSILFNLEQIDTGSDWLTDHYLSLLKRFRVWDYSAYNAVRLLQLGIPVEGICGIGFVTEHARIEQNVEEDIDVLFYGGLNERRDVVLAGLRERGLNVVVASNCFGYARDQLVARSKVVLNIHYYEAKVLEMVRISYLLANGQCVVSEVGADREEEAVFKDAIAFSAYEDLVDSCVALVNNPEKRQQLGEKAFGLFSSMRQSEFLARLLK